jgi:hypothetical protein
MFEGDRKYLNPRGIAKPLFNRDRLTGLPSESVVHICEGVAAKVSSSRKPAGLAARLMAVWSASENLRGAEKTW